MGYFNYFIKCIIRKFVNILFKPKSMFIILIAIFILYLFCGSARAEWTNQQIIDLMDELEYTNLILIEQLSDIEQVKFNTENLEDIETILSNIDTKMLTVNSYLSATKDLVNNINTTTETIRENTFMINSNLIRIISDMSTINTSIMNIYNKLDSNQQQLLTELEKDNQAVLEELNMIRDAINGSDEEPVNYLEDYYIYGSNSSAWYEQLRGYKIPVEKGYTYTFKITYNNPSDASRLIAVLSTNNQLSDGYIYNDYPFSVIGRVPVQSNNYVLEYELPSSNPSYVYFNFAPLIQKVEIYRSIKGIVESMNDSNSLQQQQNQLQQESNQLQQEQNDFLSKPSEDSDVSVDSFNNVDSNDITSSGLSGVFTTIYNSITSWNAKNINLPIPYTNKSITIPANYTESMLTNFGGSWVINFIHAVYYFIVGRFMIYSITNIINSIKSGSILETDSKNNITTDML